MDPLVESRTIVDLVLAGAPADEGSPQHVSERMVELLALARRRASGIPLCRIIGYEEFLGSRYEVARASSCPIRPANCSY
jgi:hypothetical protein